MNRSIAHAFKTDMGTPYLVEPGVILIARPRVEVEALQPFLLEADPAFAEYVNDQWATLEDADALAKVAGQACYASFGPGRSKNDKAVDYIDRILAQGHGSVLEHAVFAVFWYGISRACSHEVVRHRAGWGYSQLSQRYVGPDRVRFVMHPAWANRATLREHFFRSIDNAAGFHEATVNLLEGTLDDLDGMHPTDRRKYVQQAARMVLPNSTETWMVASGNVRAWRHFFFMRGAMDADVEIRRLAVKTFRVLRDYAPLAFGDVSVQVERGEERILVGHTEVS
jgi:thymidylate synthase (FAD)